LNDKNILKKAFQTFFEMLYFVDFPWIGFIDKIYSRGSKMFHL